MAAVWGLQVKDGVAEEPWEEHQSWLDFLTEEAREVRLVGALMFVWSADCHQCHVSHCYSLTSRSTSFYGYFSCSNVWAEPVALWAEPVVYSSSC